MIDVDPLNEQIQLAHAELAEDPKAALSLPYRVEIWASMNDPQDAEASYRHRTYLKVACVRHVQQIWDYALPGHPGLEEMLAHIQRLVDQQVDTHSAERAAHAFLDNVYSDYRAIEAMYPARMIADAACNTVMSAYERNPYYDTAGADEQDDDELLPDVLEPSWSCASAAAGGLNWQPAEQVDINARRAFWNWYLDRRSHGHWPRNHLADHRPHS